MRHNMIGAKPSNTADFSHVVNSQWCFDVLMRQVWWIDLTQHDASRGVRELSGGAQPSESHSESYRIINRNHTYNRSMLVQPKPYHVVAHSFIIGSIGEKTSQRGHPSVTCSLPQKWPFADLHTLSLHHLSIDATRCHTVQDWGLFCDWGRECACCWPQAWKLLLLISFQMSTNVVLSLGTEGKRDGYFYGGWENMLL